MNNNIIRSLTLSTMLCLTAAGAMAVPAKRMQQRIRLTDGSEITATLHGDERVSYYQAADGALYIRQAQGLYRPTSLLEIQLRANERLQAERVAEQIRLAANPKANVRRRAPRHGEALTDAFIGSKRGLVILVNFQDKSFAEANPQPFYDRMFNEDGFTEDGQTGSVHDYFSDQSYGQFDLKFDVVGPVTLSQPMAYYGAPEGDAHDTYNHMVDLVIEACKAVDGQVDFSTYDWNQDGEADQVYIIYAGYGEATGGSENSIWPHASSVNRRTLLDNTTIGTYACNNELNGGQGSKERMGIGTAIHEFSHCLGLPDFYNTTEGSGGGPRNWDIMSGGSYNGNGRFPVGYTAYERWMCGWMAPSELTEPTTITNMPSLEKEGVAYMLRHDTYENEYYLLENRQPIKWDKETGGKGLLIFHVDYDEMSWAYNNPNNDPEHERMKLVAADGDSQSDAKGDPYPGTNGLRRRFTDTSTPGAKLYNPLPDGSLKLGKPIEEITLSAQGEISFTALKGVLPRIETVDVKNVTATGFSATWQTVENAESYKVGLREVTAEYQTPEEGEVLLETFPNCFSAKVGFNNIATQLDSYTDVKGWTGKFLYTSPNGLQLGKASNRGSLKTPTLPGSVNGRISILLMLSPAATNTTAQGELVIHTSMGDLAAAINNDGSYLYYITTGEGQMSDDEYSVEIIGTNVMAIYGCIVLDGVYDDDLLNDYLRQLAPAGQTPAIQHVSTKKVGTGTAAKAAAPRRAKGVFSSYETSEAQYTFTNLDVKKTYYISVMAVGADGRSCWSKEKEVKLDPTPIQGVKATGNEDKAWYTLQGHRLSEKPGRAGLYIHGGRKVMVR